MARNAEKGIVEIWNWRKKEMAKDFQCISQREGGKETGERKVRRGMAKRKL